MPPHLFVATWLDNYDMDFGAYKAFRNERDCIDYLVEMVFWRARNLGVRVLDLDNARVDKSGRHTYPRLQRRSVTRRLLLQRTFELAIRMDEDDGTPADIVTVGITDVEVG